MDLLSGLLVYGPLGIWAVASSAAVVSLYRGQTQAQVAYDARTDELQKAHTVALAELAAIQASAAKEQAERYDKQLGELQQRSFTAVASLTDKMSALADTLADALTRSKR